jgi:hypothetical protein
MVYQHRFQEARGDFAFADYMVRLQLAGFLILSGQPQAGRKTSKESYRMPFGYLELIKTHICNIAD